MQLLHILSCSSHLYVYLHSGNHVVCADLDEKKIEGLNNGILPIYEPGLDEMAKRTFEQKRLTFSANPISSIKGVDVVFVAGKSALDCFGM